MTPMKNNTLLRIVTFVSALLVLILFRHDIPQSGERSAIEIDVLKKIASNSIIKAFVGNRIPFRCR